jgi:YD repeat-containing protein
MDVREEDRQSQSFSQATIANPAPGIAKPHNRFFRPAVLVGAVLLALRLLLLAFNLYAAFHPGSLHRYLERGFSASGFSNQTAWDPYDVEAKPPALAGSGRIYLVQMGEKKMPYSLDALAGWLRSTYSLDVEVLPSLPLEPAGYDSERKQYISQLLDDQLRRNLAARNADPNATIIGVTDADMYSISKEWASSFTQRDAAHRVSVISADCFSDRALRWLKKKPGAYAGALENALERILLRDVAVLYWHLPLNANPESVLAPMLDVTLPGHAIYQSELHPERTQWGLYVSDPCLTFTYRPAKAGVPAALDPPPPSDFIGECDGWEERSHDEQEERFQVKLEFGMLTVRHSDFYQPGAVPIEFERATSDWWKSSSLAFGRSGSHNYDQYLGSWDEMRHISVVSTGGRSEPLVRIPEWLPVLPFNRWVDQYGSGKMAELRWRPGPPEHFDLTRYTGEVESYLPCDDKTICYLDGLRGPHGEILSFERDGERSLTRLTGRDGHWLSFSYGPGKRISSIIDNRGRQVTYLYDERGFLTGVSYPSGETLQYAYDNDGHLVAFSAAPGAAEPARLLLRNEYEQGRLSRQTLADGKVFEYRYKGTASSEPVSAASVTRPDGTVLIFAMSEDGTTVRERVRH